MAYTFEQVFAADPSNPSNIAQNAAITIFAPGDGTMTPIAITDPDGQPLTNPITVNANGFGSAFAHATLDRVAWAGGGFTGFFTSYEGMKQVAVAAKAAAETSAAAASSAQASATTAAQTAAATVTDQLAEAVADAEAAAASAADSAALVGTPPDSAIAAAINGANTETRAALAPYAKKDRVYLADYLSLTRTPGTTDDTAAFVNAITAAAGTTLVIAPGLYKASDVLEFITDNVTVEARGAIIELVDDGTAEGRNFRATDCENFTWIGGRILQPAGARTGVYGLLSLFRAENVRVDGLATVGGSSTGIYAEGGSAHRYVGVSVTDSKADGIHVSRGITDVVIDRPSVLRAGDDGIAVVSVLSDGATTYPQIQRVEINNPSVRDSAPLGNGVVFIGSKFCELNGGILSNLQNDGVKMSKDDLAGATLPASFITVTGTIAERCERGFSFGASEDCTLTGAQGINNRDIGIAAIGSTRSHVVGGQFRGNVFGLFEDSATGMNAIGTDLRGNTTAPFQKQTATLTDCVTV